MTEPTTDERSSPTLLLTGASGFLGRHVARRLVADGAIVHGVHRRDLDDPPAGVEAWHRVDLEDADAARDLVETVRPDGILHLASHVAGARDLDLVLPTFRANLASTVHLLDALARLDLDHDSDRDGERRRRFVQIGSLEEPDADQAAPVPSSPYAAAKAAASAYARLFDALYDVEVVLARVFMVYGPGAQDENKLVPYVIRSLLAGETPKLSSGRRPVDWIYVEDVAEGLARLATADSARVAGQRVDLGTGRLATVAEVVEKLFERLAPDASPGFGDLADRRAEQVRRADVAATEAVLDWRPSTPLDEGLERTIAWFRSGSEAG